VGHGPARPYVSRRQFLQRSAALGIATASGPFFWQQLAHAADAPVEQVHGQFGSDAGREAAFSWMTPAAVAAPFVQIGQQRVPAQTVQYAGYPGFFHHARLSDLLPATRYPYAVGHAGQVRSARFTWSTGPLPGTPFMFTAFGDQGTDVPEPGTVQDIDPTTLQSIKVDQQPPFQASLNRDLAMSMKPAFHAIVGDTAYANGDQDVWDHWFRGISPMATSAPWMPCLGNHEIETMGVGIGGFNPAEELGLPGGDSWGPLGYDAYRHRFALPSNGDPEWEGCWYRFRYGSVEFVSLDNNDVNTEVPANRGYSNGRQRAFAERALQAAAADPSVDFLIVLMHQAAFSSGLHGSDQGVRDAWFPLFTKYGVDLVIQGHDHHYERTHLMRGADVELAADGDYVSDVGTMYVVAGNGGGVQRGEGLGGGGEFTAKIASERIGTLRVDVVPNTGKGTKRLVLAEYDALTREPIEQDIVIERTRPAVAPHPAPAAAPAAAASREEAVTSMLPATGGPAGIGAAGLVLGAGAAAAAVVRRRCSEEVREHG
jgi:hypothetical protein